MRRWTATFYRHDGNVDSYGQPTYKTDADWDVVTQTWPCELTTKDRCTINGKNYGISAIIDADGLQMERRIELRGEF
jgi:hypothetical protein